MEDYSLTMEPVFAYEEPGPEMQIHRRMNEWTNKELRNYLNHTESAERRRKWGVYSAIGIFYLFLIGAGVFGYASKSNKGAVAAPIALSGLVVGGGGVYRNRSNGLTTRREIAQEILESRIRSHD